MEANESSEPPSLAETKESSSSEDRKPIGKRLVYKAPPPPTNAAPKSDVIENVKKRVIVMPKSAPPAAMMAVVQGGGFVPKVRGTPLKSDDSDDEKSDDSYERGRRSYTDRNSDHSYKKSLDVSSDCSPDVEEDSYYDDQRKEKGKDNIGFDEEDEVDDTDDAPADVYAGSKDDGSYARRQLISKAPIAEDKGSSRSSLSNISSRGKLIAYNFQNILKATYRELRHFVLSPCDPGTIVKCYIERNRSGSNFFQPFYSLCADLEDGTGRELIVCRKVASLSSHYIFSLKQEDLWLQREKRSRLYLGKLRKLSSNDYVLYDHGTLSRSDDDADSKSSSSGKGNNSTKATGDNDDSEGEEITDVRLGTGVPSDAHDASLFRKELAVIHFNTKKRPPPPGVRGTEVCVPNNNFNSMANPDLYTADDKNNSTKCSKVLVAPFSRVRAAGKQNELLASKIFILNERTSKYDPLSSCLVDFKGRANVASVKNFQLVESGSQDSRVTQAPDGEKEFLLQMGKTTDDCYNMDFKHPLSLLQAFAICVSRFDAKLTW